MKLRLLIVLLIAISCKNGDRLSGRWQNAAKTIDCEFLEGNKYRFAGRNPFKGHPDTGSYEFENDTLYLYANAYGSHVKHDAYFRTKITFRGANEIAFGEEPLYRKE